jgi:nucleotide-binding universal stress UspA family protein
MTVRHIILHMGSDEAHASRFRTALALAKEKNAHLEIAFTTAPTGMPAAIQGRGASSAYIAEATAIAREKADQIYKEISEQCIAGGVEWSWEVLEGDPNRLLADRSLFADVIVVSQDHGVTFEDYVGLHAPDELIMQASCSVLVLPKNVETPTVGRRILIAWHDTRQAAHAVRRGRDFLEQADKIYLLTCDRPHHRYEKGRDIAGYLRRHDVEVEQVSDVADSNIGATILSYAEDLKADMIVMGAYGRSRWREILTGGVTHHVLSHMKIPVLTSH